MSNCRAGLYSFAPTTTWLREMGTASPPHLVVLGLVLPDSRILSGIASIGLTLANIVFILPYLRQPLLDSVHAGERTVAHEQDARRQIKSLPNESNVTQPVDVNVRTPMLASALPPDNEHQSVPLAHNAIVEFVLSPVIKPLECSDMHPKAAPLAVRPQIPPQSDRTSNANATGKLTSSSSLLMREGRSALYISLPVPDEAEIAFFDSADTLLSDLDLDLGEVFGEQDTLLEEDSTMEDDELIAVDDIRDCQLRAPDLFNAPGRVLGGGLAEAEMPLILTDGDVAHAKAQCTVHTELSVIENDKRPESLNFIPQSVVSRYPSVVVSTGRCHEHPTFNFGQLIPHSPRNSALLPSGAIPQADHVVSAAFFPEVQSHAGSGGQTLVFDTILTQEPLSKDPASLLERPVLHELTSSKQYSSRARRRRLGVLARAALRNRRLFACRRISNENDGSSASDSDSDSDSDLDSSDSQLSSGSSADSEMLPLMLGADLLAALDANSESELNLADHERTSRAPLTMYQEFLISDSSVADTSMIMQVSSIDDAGEETKVPVPLRSLNYEDIQQWASGVVQKCVRQVCRNRAAAEPSSPSQASDVCAEKPSGISQCPFSGLHCKLGAGPSGHRPAPRADERPVSQLPTLTLPPKEAIPARNICDIPEFVPRQRLVSTSTRKVEGHWRPNARPAIDVTRDAAAKVIARLESQAGFNPRPSLVGVDPRRARGGHGALRNA